MPKSKQLAKTGGPKSVEGKLAAAMNSTKHGILSPKPVVATFESKTGWKTHRQSILDALAPADGIEQALAERVALNSWRLNRVIVYETESIRALQDGIVDEMRKNKQRYPMLSMDDPNPDAPAEAEKRRGIYADAIAVCEENTTPGSKAEHHISAAGLSWIHEQAPYYAAAFAAAIQEDPHVTEAEAEDHLISKSDELEAALEAHLEVEVAIDGESGWPSTREISNASNGWPTRRASWTASTTRPSKASSCC